MVWAKGGEFSSSRCIGILNWGQAEIYNVLSLFRPDQWITPVSEHSPVPTPFNHVLIPIAAQIFDSTRNLWPYFPRQIVWIQRNFTTLLHTVRAILVMSFSCLFYLFIFLVHTSRKMQKVQFF